MNDDYCVVCGKQLFQNGVRLTKLCYYIGAGYRKIDNKHCWYADGTLGGVHICKECFSEKNKQKITDVLFGKIFYGDEENRYTLVDMKRLKNEKI